MIKKVLFFGNYPNEIDPNFTIFYRNLIYAIAEQGVDCTVITPVSITKYRTKLKRIPRFRTEETPNGAQVKVYSPRYISFSNLKIGKIKIGRLGFRLMRKAAEHQVKRLSFDYDATYGHFINIGGVTACKIAYEHSVPSFVANGESDLEPSAYNYQSGLRLEPFRHCSGVISVSGKNRDELIERGLIDRSKIRVYPNAINPVFFHPHPKEECRKRFGFSNDDVIACFVGSFFERKGNMRVLEAARTIPGLRLSFVGSGKDVPAGDNVVFCGTLRHDEELPYMLSACDFFVLPTLNEGCCNAIIEAMACGLPIVSSALPFNDEILDSSNSILVNPNSIEELNSAMSKMYEDKTLREKLSFGSITKAKDLTIEKRAARIIEYMNEVQNDYIKRNEQEHH